MDSRKSRGGSDSRASKEESKGVLSRSFSHKSGKNRSGNEGPSIEVIDNSKEEDSMSFSLIANELREDTSSKRSVDMRKRSSQVDPKLSGYSRNSSSVTVVAQSEVTTSNLFRSGTTDRGLSKP